MTCMGASSTGARWFRRLPNVRCGTRPALNSGIDPMVVTFNLNGNPVEVEVESRTTLVDCLRHQLGLTGTHVGCEHGVCGACTVLYDGWPMRSCLMFAPQANGHEIETV